MTAQPSLSDQDLQAAIRLFRTNDDFRGELKSVISEALQPLFLKFKADLLGELSSQDVSPSSSKKQFAPALGPAKYIYREFPHTSITTWTHRDEEGFIYGFPDEITAIIFVHNSTNYLCNSRDVVDVANVIYLIRVGKLYKNLHHSKPLACVIICHHIDPKAKAIADKCKMKIIMCSP